MPEIAEVARLVHFLRKHLVGKRISKITAQDDDIIFGKAGTSGAAFQSSLAGKRVVAAGSQGKYFWLELESPPHAVMHLGMTGWIHVRGEQTAYTRYADRLDPAARDNWPPKFWKFDLEAEGVVKKGQKPDPKTKTHIAFTDARRFGRIRLVDCAGSLIRRTSPLSENGPDPVVDRKTTFTKDYLTQKMRSRRVPIKALLLDQSVISGVGNWVCDEILYHARRHPEQYCDTFGDDDIEKLYESVCYVCDTAVGVLGDSDQFPEDWLFNHRWGKGKKGAATTLPSGEKIEFLTVGGRTSCIVPERQKMARSGIAAGSVKQTSKSRKTSSSGEIAKHEEDDAEQGVDEPPKKKVKTSRARKGATKKEVGEGEEEEGETANGHTSKETISRKGKAETKSKGRKMEKPGLPPAPIPDSGGRRRSTRLSRSTT